MKLRWGDLPPPLQNSCDVKLSCLIPSAPSKHFFYFFWILSELRHPEILTGGLIFNRFMTSLRIRYLDLGKTLTNLEMLSLLISFLNQVDMQTDFGMKPLQWRDLTNHRIPEIFFHSINDIVRVSSQSEASSKEIELLVHFIYSLAKLQFNYLTDSFFRHQSVLKVANDNPTLVNKTSIAVTQLALLKAIRVCLKRSSNGLSCLDDKMLAKLFYGLRKIQFPFLSLDRKDQSLFFSVIVEKNNIISPETFYNILHYFSRVGEFTESGTIEDTVFELTPLQNRPMMTWNRFPFKVRNSFHNIIYRVIHEISNHSDAVEAYYFPSLSSLKEKVPIEKRDKPSNYATYKYLTVFLSRVMFFFGRLQYPYDFDTSEQQMLYSLTADDLLLFFPLLKAEEKRMVQDLQIKNKLFHRIILLFYYKNYDHLLDGTTTTNWIHGVASILSRSHSQIELGSDAGKLEESGRCLIPKLYQFHLYTILISVLSKQTFTPTQFATVIWSISQLMTGRWIRNFHDSLLSPTFDVKKFIRTDKNILQLHTAISSNLDLLGVILQKLELHLANMNDYQFIWTLWSLGRLGNDYESFSKILQQTIEEKLEAYCNVNCWSKQSQKNILKLIPPFRLLLLSLINLKIPLNSYSSNVREYFVLGLQELLVNPQLSKFIESKKFIPSFNPGKLNNCYRERAEM